MPNRKAFGVDTPEDHVKMHQLLLAKKDSGNSTAVCSLLSFLEKDKVLDRLFVITSSWISNNVGCANMCLLMLANYMLRLRECS